ncbi:MAG: gluconokinase [Gammaproteobacteria bacterium]
MAAPLEPRVVVVMGVSGCGKTTVGQALATRLGGAFLEGDALHTAASIAKLRAGQALDDEDRAPWLSAIAAWIARTSAEHAWGVVACSALRRRYRDTLRAAVPHALPFVLLEPPAWVLRERLRRRTGHFMPASLLDSQLRTLERPTADECALIVAAALDVAGTCERIVRWLGTCERRA